PLTDFTPSLLSEVTNADFSLFFLQNSSKLFSPVGFSKKRFDHLISSAQFGFSVFLLSPTRSTSPWDLPDVQLAYQGVNQSRCNHCAKIAVSTMLPTPSSVGCSGE